MPTSSSRRTVRRTSKRKRSARSVRPVPTSWPFRLMVLMLIGGCLTIVATLAVILVPTKSEAVAPFRIMVVVTGPTPHHVIGTSQHSLVIEALASASASIDQPFSYRFVGNNMVPSVMFGLKNDPVGSWVIRLNDRPLTNLWNVSFERGDQITVERKTSL